MGRGTNRTAAIVDDAHAAPPLRMHPLSRGRAEINPYARLAAAAANLRTGTLDPKTREQLAESLERIASGEDAATALGVKRTPGQRTVQTCSALAERDRLLREAAERFQGGLSVAAQAECLRKELLRYHASAWQRERVREQCPDRHLGNLNEYLWRVLKSRDYVLSARALRLILAAS
jgi:hypothetical protein